MLELKSKKDLALYLEQQTYKNFKHMLENGLTDVYTESPNMTGSVVVSVTKQFDFSFAHILKDSFTDACHDHIHGHNMTVILELYYHKSVGKIFMSLNNDNMVIDFTLMKSLCKGIHDVIDHRFLCPEDKLPVDYPFDGGIITAFFNPTSEMLGMTIGCAIKKTLKDIMSLSQEIQDETTLNLINSYLLGVYVKSVSVKETDNNVATCNFC